MFCDYGYSQDIYYTMCLGGIIWLCSVIMAITRISTLLCVLLSLFGYVLLLWLFPGHLLHYVSWCHYLAMFCDYGYSQDIYYTMCLGGIIWLCSVIMAITRISTTLCVLVSLFGYILLLWLFPGHLLYYVSWCHYLAMFCDYGYSQDIYYTMCHGVII